MDEKDLLRRVRNSQKAKKSELDILKSFQNKGYKLDYANKILEKANRPRKIALISLMAFTIFILVSITGYSLIQSLEASSKTMPITGMAVAKTPEEMPSEPQVFSEGTTKEIPLITSELISSVLIQIGAGDLHTALFFGDPIINFQVDSKNFYSEVEGGKVYTYQGSHQEADLSFVSNSNEVLKLSNSNNPKAAIKESIGSGETTVEIIAGNTELFAKGYLKLYDSLK